MPDVQHERQTPGEAAREEGARQAVALGAMLIAIPVAVWLERRLSGPDAGRELRMRALKKGERAAATAAAEWWRAAEWCRAAYEREAGR